ncbi:biotin-dependent carboxyltransferase family protein [Phocicoccus pinnipedialis]|uniref:KipI antagonist n=1 Tax=Phocicoccus pinnipedialis TaxID=110845 RepID=A0A6V7R9Q0_9BACL|nr:biotin-dependent carboxyltransferase family protein [Jeotgalicoccus pinnipedialis]MBP1940178.1 antagonist of KipI [Jeotgalicoccus pinnipedialis]CAD2073873.1 KipI antagonist [Jeotgalicoccus pinnipedialis]
MIRIIKPGMYSSIQDSGRSGTERYGQSESGAMNYRAMMLSNKMLDNPLNNPVIEMTVVGPEFEVLDNITIAVFGTEKITLNGSVITTKSYIKLSKGDHVKVGRLLDARGYMAFRGKIISDEAFGSQSTHSQLSSIKALKAGDIIEVDIVNEPRLAKKKMSKYPTVKTYKGKPVIRVILGEDTDHIHNLNVFFKEPYTIKSDSNRMAIKLMGKSIQADNYDIVSDATRLGLIQVTKDGNPMILMNDRQTTGGYLRLGTVAKIDLPVLVDQRLEGNVYFEEVTIEEARSLFMEEMERIEGSYYLP